MVGLGVEELSAKTADSVPPCGDVLRFRGLRAIRAYAGVQCVIFKGDLQGQK